MMFHQRLRELRKEKKLKQKELAEILGVSPSAIIRYENNNRHPDREVLIRFSDYFQVSVEYLLGRTNSRLSLDEFNGNELMKLVTSPEIAESLKILNTLSENEVQLSLRFVRFLQSEAKEREAQKKD